MTGDGEMGQELDLDTMMWSTSSATPFAQRLVTIPRSFSRCGAAPKELRCSFAEEVLQSPDRGADSAGVEACEVERVLPTPFHALPNLSAAYGVNFFTKREDLAGSSVSPGATTCSTRRWRHV